MHIYIYIYTHINRSVCTDNEDRRTLAGKSNRRRRSEDEKEVWVGGGGVPFFSGSRIYVYTGVCIYVCQCKQAKLKCPKSGQANSARADMLK